MDEFKPLIDALFLEEVERARKLTPGEKISAALDLCDWHHGKDDPEVRRRKNIVRRLEEARWYGPPQDRL